MQDLIAFPHKAVAMMRMTKLLPASLVAKHVRQSYHQGN
jgi:hypothetical protein